MSKKLKIYLLAVLTFLVSIFSMTACDMIMDFIFDAESPVGKYYVYSIEFDSMGTDKEAINGTYHVGDTLPALILPFDDDVTLEKTTAVVELEEDGTITFLISYDGLTFNYFQELGQQPTWEEKDGEIVIPTVTIVDTDKGGVTCSMSYENNEFHIRQHGEGYEGDFDDPSSLRFGREDLHITFKKDTSSSKPSDTNKNSLLGTYYTQSISDGTITYNLGDAYSEVGNNTTGEMVKTILTEDTFIIQLQEGAVILDETTVRVDENDEEISREHYRLQGYWSKDGNSISLIFGENATLQATANDNLLIIQLPTASITLKKGVDLSENPKYSYEDNESDDDEYDNSSNVHHSSSALITSSEAARSEETTSESSESDSDFVTSEEEISESYVSFYVPEDSQVLDPGTEEESSEVWQGNSAGSYEVPDSSELDIPEEESLEESLEN
ncbi:MAG: hypothetical protein IKD47_01700 [Clostridia bacterium]|nr:hypothetical protein [Clostridia bacterium]